MDSAADWADYFDGSELSEEKSKTYAAAFSKNGLGLNDLNDFDHELLTSMGVSVAKDRIVILKWIKQNKDGKKKPKKEKVKDVKKEEKKADTPASPKESKGKEKDADKQKSTTPKKKASTDKKKSKKGDPSAQTDNGAQALLHMG